MNLHTSKPWKHDGTGTIRVNGKIIARGLRSYDAERIVACVNACLDLSTESLEKDVIANLLTVARDLLNALESEDKEESVLRWSHRVHELLEHFPQCQLAYSGER